MATSILCSQYVGAGQRNRVLQVMGVSVLFNFLIGVAFSVFLYGKASALLGMMGAREELFAQGFPYMRIVGAFAFFQAVSLSAAAALRSVDKAHYPMFVSGLVNVINILGNYALIFGKFGLPVVTYFINFLGNDELATRTYGQTITTFVFLFSLAAAQGGAIAIGHLTGMKKYAAAFALGRRVLRISLAVPFAPFPFGSCHKQVLVLICR